MKHPLTYYRIKSRGRRGVKGKPGKGKEKGGMKEKVQNGDAETQSK